MMAPTSRPLTEAELAVCKILCAPRLAGEKVAYKIGVEAVLGRLGTIEFAREVLQLTGQSLPP